VLVVGRHRRHSADEFPDLLRKPSITVHEQLLGDAMPAAQDLPAGFQQFRLAWLARGLATFQLRNGEVQTLLDVPGLAPLSRAIDVPNNAADRANTQFCLCCRAFRRCASRCSIAPRSLYVPLASDCCVWPVMLPRSGSVLGSTRPCHAQHEFLSD
jgi:hypothetical protein